MSEDKSNIKRLSRYSAIATSLGCEVDEAAYCDALRRNENKETLNLENLVDVWALTEIEMERNDLFWYQKPTVSQANNASVPYISGQIVSMLNSDQSAPVAASGLFGFWSSARIIAADWSKDFNEQ